MVREGICTGVSRLLLDSMGGAHHVAVSRTTAQRRGGNGTEEEGGSSLQNMKISVPSKDHRVPSSRGLDLAHAWSQGAAPLPAVRFAVVVNTA